MRRLLPLTTALAVAIGGCGGGGEDREPGRTVAVEAGATVPVDADEYSFDPETIEVSGAGEITFELANRGVLAHNLRVFDAGGDIGGTPTFAGGETRPGTVRLEPGEYRLVCTVANHEELGMVGALRVE